MKTVVNDSLEKKSNRVCFCQKEKNYWTLILNSPRRNDERNWAYPKATWRVFQELKAGEVFDSSYPPGIPSSENRFVYQERWKKESCNESPVESNKVNYCYYHFQPIFPNDNSWPWPCKST